MADLFENPMGLCGLEFVEFTAPERGVIDPVFQAMGFTHSANHRSKDVELWRQRVDASGVPGAEALWLTEVPEQRCAEAV